MMRLKAQGARFNTRGVFYSTLLIFSTLFLLSACGFHLRGELALPKGAEHIFITGVDPSLPLAHEIARLYTRAGGTVVDKREQADAVLDILSESSDRRVSAVTSEGLVSQYELYYSLSFRLLNMRGEIIHPASSVGVTRDYSFDPNNVLGKEQEETLIRDDMRQQAISQMLRRLSRGTHPPQPASEVPVEAPVAPSGDTNVQPPANAPVEAPTASPAATPTGESSDAPAP